MREPAATRRWRRARCQGPGSASHTRPRRRPPGLWRRRRRTPAGESAGSRAGLRPSRARVQGRRGRRPGGEPEPVLRPERNAARALEYDEAGTEGGRRPNVWAVPPSWSTNTSVFRGRGSPRLQRWTITPPTPFGAGRPETTTRAAFWRGVSPSKGSGACGAGGRGHNRARKAPVQERRSAAPSVH